MSEGPDETVPTEVLAETPAAVEPETPTTTEETAEGEKPEAEEESEERPKRESGYSREKRRRIAEEGRRVATEAKLQRAQDELRQFRDAQNSKESEKPPLEEESGGDWAKHLARSTAFETKKVLHETLAEERRVALETRVADAQAELVADYTSQLGEVREAIPDFDRVAKQFADSGRKFSPALEQLLLEGEHGPRLTYHLTKNPALVDKLNSLSPLRAAKEIARIEDSLSKPSKATQAKAPITPPKGGASGSFDPATASMDEYVAKRKAGWGK